MKPRAALFALALAAAPALAATTSTVVDVPVEGGTQRFLYLRPDAPVANIVAVPGGDGTLGIQADGSMTSTTATCFPVARNRQAFAARGFSVALVDATSTGSVYNFNDVREVVRYLQARDNVPTWVIGGSSSTGTIVNLALNLPAASAVGAVFFSPGFFSAAEVALIRRPSLVVYHTGDTGQTGNAFFNALTSASARERAALSGGSNAACGYHLFNGLDDTFVSTVAGFIDRYNGSFATADWNVQGLWWKSPPGSESGWGVNLTHQGDTLFATWFTYDRDGRGLWLVMSSGARIARNTYSGTLYRTTGPAFSAVPFDSSQVRVTPVGSATFTFTDASNGTFSSVVNGISQARSITRQVYSSPVPECVAGGSPGATPNYQALWWAAPAASEQGWGLNVTHQGDVLFATWFTYDSDGNGMWLVMSSGTRTAAATYSGALYRTTGPAFSTEPWTGSVVATQVGTVSLAFSDPDNGTFTYTVNGFTQSKRITRQVYASPASVCR